MTLLHPSLSIAAASPVFRTGADDFARVEDWLTRELAAGHLTTRQVGDLFEVFVEALLRMYPVIGAKEVWPHGRIPERVRDRLRLGPGDRGVDGAFLTDDELGAYQVKFRSRTDTLSWRDLSTFVGLSEFAERRLVVTTAGGVAPEARSGPNLSSLLGGDLRSLSPEDLSRIFTLIRAGVALPREQPHRGVHQEAAVRAVVDRLTASPRATALMACGSGKTFVGLWSSRNWANLPVSTHATLSPTLPLPIRLAVSLSGSAI